MINGKTMDQLGLHPSKREHRTPFIEESQKPQELMLGGGDTCQGDSGGPLIRSELPEVLLL